MQKGFEYSQFKKKREVWYNTIGDKTIVFLIYASSLAIYMYKR